MLNCDAALAQTQIGLRSLRLTDLVYLPGAYCEFPSTAESSFQCCGPWASNHIEIRVASHRIAQLVPQHVVPARTQRTSDYLSR